MNYPKVSVVIAVGRDMPLYEESLKKQDYPNYEILPISGYSAAKARNIGIEKAKGDIIAFIDDDVIIPERWMSKSVELLKKSGADIVGGPNIIFQRASIGERTSDFLLSTGILNGFRKKFSKWAREGFSDYRNFATCNMMLRKSVFDSVRYFDDKYRFSEDMEFLLRCSINRLKFYFSPEIFLYHKRRSFPFGHARQVFLWGRGNMQLALNYTFVFKRPDIWGSIILFPVSLAIAYFNFKLAIIMGIILFPIAVHFLSYSLGVIVGMVDCFMGRK